MKTLASFSPVVLAVALLASLLQSSRGAALEWPEFRGPTGQGLSTATQVPTEWSATHNIRWKQPIPGNGWSSPALSGGRIYLTSGSKAENEADISLRALCLDAGTGSLVWNVEALRSPEGQMHQKNSLASPTAIVRDGRVYVHFGHMGTAAVDLEGKVLWRQTEVKYEPVHGNGGSPALVGDLLVFSCDGAKDPFLTALDAKTGAVRWKTERRTTAGNKFSFSTPLAIEVDGQTQIISPASGFMGAYDPKDGREIWRARYGEGYSVITRPVFAHGLLFVSSSFNRPELYAVKPAGAKGDVTETHIAWKQGRGAANTPSTLVLGDEVYMVSDSGIATCLDARTGSVHWTERLGGGYSASPIAAEGRVYFQNEEGVTTVLKAGKTFTVLAKNELGERSLASPAVIDNALFIRTAGHLWRIGK